DASERKDEIEDIPAFNWQLVNLLPRKRAADNRARRVYKRLLAAPFNGYLRFNLSDFELEVLAHGGARRGAHTWQAQRAEARHLHQPFIFAGRERRHAVTPGLVAD